MQLLLFLESKHLLIDLFVLIFQQIYFAEETQLNIRFRRSLFKMVQTLRLLYLITFIERILLRFDFFKLGQMSIFRFDSRDDFSSVGSETFVRLYRLLLEREKRI